MKFSSSTITSSSRLQSALLAYGVFAGALVAYNLRWKYLGDAVFGRKTPKTLPIIKVVVKEDKTKKEKKKKKKKPIVVLLHGMWHDASWYGDFQAVLKDRGYTSYAVELLPGERFLPGFSQKEIVADLEATLLSKEEDDNEYILVGHSQGGLTVQSCLFNSPQLKNRTQAVALLATYPLGLTPPVGKILKEPRNMYNKLGYAGICLTGKLISVSYLKHIFLLPTTNVDDSSLQDYANKLLKAPSDGLVTMSHFPQKVGAISTKPTLVLGAEQDIIYPPHLLREDFDSRFPNATHKTIPNQAHCFMDPVKDGQPNSNMKSVLTDWLDVQTMI